MRKLPTILIVLAVGTLVNAAYDFQGGDAADMASADSILDVVFISDTSPSMNDDIDNISNGKRLAALRCSLLLIGVRISCDCQQYGTTR